MRAVLHRACQRVNLVDRCIVTDAIRLGEISVPVHLRKALLDLKHRYAARAHRQDFLMDPIEAAVVLLDQLRRERAMTIARHPDQDLAALGGQIGRGALASVAAAVDLATTRLIPEMVGELGAQCTLDQRPDELLSNLPASRNQAITQDSAQVFAPR